MGRAGRESRWMKSSEQSKKMCGQKLSCNRERAAVRRGHLQMTFQGMSQAHHHVPTRTRGSEKRWRRVGEQGSAAWAFEVPRNPGRRDTSSRQYKVYFRARSSRTPAPSNLTLARLTMTGTESLPASPHAAAGSRSGAELNAKLGVLGISHD